MTLFSLNINLNIYLILKKYHSTKSIKLLEFTINKKKIIKKIL
jgi:hypothetical protein